MSLDWVWLGIRVELLRLPEGLQESNQLLYLLVAQIEVKRSRVVSVWLSRMVQYYLLDHFQQLLLIYCRNAILESVVAIFFVGRVTATEQFMVDHCLVLVFGCCFLQGCSSRLIGVRRNLNAQRPSDASQVVIRLQTQRSMQLIILVAQD